VNTQTTNQNDPQHIELRIRTMRILWIGMVLSICAYFMFTFFKGRSEGIEPNPSLSLMLVSVGLITTLISFPIKNKLLTRAVEQQQAQLVQQGYIVTWAVTEVAALLGLLDFFLTGHRHYYILFIIAACGQLLHYPRREHVMNASFKGSI